MTHKHVSIYKETPSSSGINLAIRMEQTESERRPETTCMIELNGPSLEKPEAFPISKDLVKHIQEGVGWLREVDLPEFRGRSARDLPATVQQRCEDDKTGLVVMREMSEFTDRDMKTCYKLGNGAGVDYVFKDFDSLERFVRNLERAVSRI